MSDGPPREAVTRALREAADDRTLNALIKLARKDLIVVQGYDEDAEEFKWSLSERAVAMYENYGQEYVAQYIRAAERPGLPEEPEFTRYIEERDSA